MLRFLVTVFLGLSVDVINAQTLILNQLCSLPSEVTETSGLENGPNGCLWTHNDSGNGATLYCVDTTCTIVRTVSITDATNSDWEDLTKDDQGNMYIGDFGNNALSRTDLRIYIVPAIDAAVGSAAVSDTILFSYPDQLNFPPAGNYGNFDMEAMVCYNDSLYLFSKDRSNPSTGYTKRYRLPTDGGTYIAELIDSFETGHTSFIFSISAADLSEDNSQLVLLNSDRLWLFSNYSGSDFFGGNVAELEFGSFTQKEGIVFRNGFIYLTDENSFGFGGNLYRVHPSLLVSIDELSDQVEIRPVYNADMRLVEVHFSNELRNASWQLFSLDGKLMKSGNVENSILTAEEIGIGSGVYVLRSAIDKRSVKALMVRL